MGGAAAMPSRPNQRPRSSPVRRSTEAPTPETPASEASKPAPKAKPKKPVVLSDYTLAVMGDVKKPTTEELINDSLDELPGTTSDDLTNHIAEGIRPPSASFHWETNTMPDVYWDIETRSAVNLRECGAHVYAIDPTTQITLPRLRGRRRRAATVVARRSSSAVFSQDRSDPNRLEARRAQIGIRARDPRGHSHPAHGFPADPTHVQHCTQRLALTNAYPAELDLLAQALGLPYRKDPGGTQGDAAGLASEAPTASARPARSRSGTKIPTICG